MTLILVENKDRFAKAKALHSRLEPMSPPKLQIVCFDFFISIADKIVSGWKKSGENIFDQLSKILRIDMLNYLFSEAHEKDGNEEQLMKHLNELTCMLMNEKTVKLEYSINNIPWLITTFQAFGEILAHAAVKCPNLEHLAVQGKEKDVLDTRFTEAKDVMTPGSGIDHLLQLDQLQHLDIFGLWYWTDEGLNKLFSNLKKLITLKLLIHSRATFGGFHNITLLKELEEFHFVIDNPDEEYDSDDDYCISWHYGFIYSFCAENVPTIRLIGAPTRNCSDNPSYFSFLRFISPKIRGTSELEHLHTYRTLPTAEFPNLQHLHFCGPVLSCPNSKFFKKFGTFTHLTELNLCHLSSLVVAKMLELVGTQLNTLTVSLGETGDLFQILHLCPNLVTFKQDERRFNNEVVHEPWVLQTSNYEALVTEHNVRLLERCDAKFDGLHGGKDRLFELLVFAPFMKYLHLMHFSLTKTQSQLFHDVEKGKLSNLRSIIIDELELDPSCSMDDVGLMVQCLVCSAPRLHSIALNWNDEDMTDKWDLEQNVAQSFIDLL